MFFSINLKKKRVLKLFENATCLKIVINKQLFFIMIFLNYFNNFLTSFAFIDLRPIWLSLIYISTILFLKILKYNNSFI